MMLTCSTNSITLGNLGDDILTGAARSLELLKAIDTTIAALCYDAQYFMAFAEFSKKFSSDIRKNRKPRIIDPNGAVQEKLLRAQQKVRSVYDRLIEKRKHAISDPHLTDEDGVVDEFTRTINAVADLNNAINELRLVIGENDADLSPRKNGPILHTPEEVEKFLLTL